MEYKFFDKQFLVMPDDKSIIGKRVFYRDTLAGIICEVENGDTNSDRYGVLDDILIGSAHPFYIDDTYWGLVYYDPNYEAKVAYSQGKQIQYKAADAKWEDVTEKPLWCERNVYRVKPDTWYVHPFVDKDGNCIGHPFYKDISNKTFVSFEGTEEECDTWIAEHTPKTRRMTNRELTRWLAEGKGQISKNRLMCTTYYYRAGCDDTPVPDTVKIRAWSESEWHEPLVEVVE